MTGPVRCEAVIELSAVRANVRALRSRLRPGTALMAVVKADGYGHGAVPVAGAALAAGADLLGVATPAEAVALRAAGVDARLVAWLWTPLQDPGPALALGVELGVSSPAQLDAVLAAGDVGGRPRIHLKVDTGLGRGGAAGADIAVLLAAAATAAAAGRVEVVGLMSHLASADIPGDPSVAEQAAAFAAARQAAAAAGLTPAAHLANTAAVLDHPELQLDLVRTGIGLYGLSPVADPAGLRPAMTLRAAVALTKRVPAGHGVSYGLTYRTKAETTLALVPIGYGDGVPRAASNAAEVLIGDARRRIAGRVAMDQFVVDCGDAPVSPGDEVLLFGPGDRGEPTARDWAVACGTIDYEIVTRIGPRTPRRYTGRDDEPPALRGD
ncbi:alanine racemase [Nakamurella lactea]|uniref:alanine racemase n=1 Tax=Nakamurella lactea TaxID=459515 RepID=UPI000491F5A5|nr:alanine racemase [Nakamurella lactea]